MFCLIEKYQLYSYANGNSINSSSTKVADVLRNLGCAGLNPIEWLTHYRDVIMNTIATQITSLTIVHLAVYSGSDQRKHQSSASLAFVRGIHHWPVNSPHKWPVTRKMFPFDDVIMYNGIQASFPSCCFLLHSQSSRGWFNIKMTSHHAVQGILRPSYLHNGISCTGKMTSVNWIKAHVLPLYDGGIVDYWVNPV